MCMYRYPFYFWGLSLIVSSLLSVLAKLFWPFLFLFLLHPSLALAQAAAGAPAASASSSSNGSASAGTCSLTVGKKRKDRDEDASGDDSVESRAIFTRPAHRSASLDSVSSAPQTSAPQHRSLPTQDMMALLDDFHAAMSNNIQAVSEENIALKARLGKQEETIIKQRNRRKKGEEIIKGINYEKELLQSQVNDMKGAVQDEEKKVQAERNEKALTKTRLDSILKEFGEETKKNRSLQSELDKTKEEKNTLEKNNVSLQSQLEKALSELESTKKETSQLEKKFKEKAVLAFRKSMDSL